MKLTNLFFLFFIGISITSCDDDNMVLPEKTLLEVHQENLNTVSVNGFQMSYLEAGASNDKTLILLHGIPTSSFLYRKVVNDIAVNAGFRVIAPDMLGFGQSDKPQTAVTLTVDEQAQRVFGFATAIGVDDFVLGLHDVSGIWGMSMLKKSEANRILGLVLTDTNVGLEGSTPSPTNLPVLTGQATPREVWQQLDDADFARNSTEEFLTIGLFDDALLTEELLNAYVSPLTEGTSEAYIQLFETFPEVAFDPDLTSTMENFDKPTALVWGKEDAFFDDEIVTDYFKTHFDVSDDYVTIVPNGGHYIQEEAPNEFTAAIVQFLNEQF